MVENRFKKSILNATDNTQENIAENSLQNTIDKAIENTDNNILKKVLESGKKDKGSNHTIYLSADVGAALVKYAKKSKKSKSTLVDEILHEVLIFNC